MSIKDFRTKDEIVIAIKPGSRAVAETSKAGRQPIPGQKPRKRALSRRRSKSAIRFFDLGQYLSGGVYVSNDFMFSPGYSIVGDSLIFDTVTTADMDPLVTEITDVAAADRAATFYRIPKNATSHEKCINVAYTGDGGPVSGTLDTLADWTAAGLQLTPAEAASITAVSALSLFFCGGIDFATSLITSTLNPADPPAAFTPSPAMDIYLMPNVVLNSVDVNYRNGLHSETGPPAASDRVEYTEILNRNLNVIPRSLGPEYFNIDFGTTDYFVFRQYLAIIRQLTGGRAFQGIRDFAPAPPYPYSTAWFSISAGAVPFSTIYTPAGIVNATDTFNVSFGSSFAFIGPAYIELAAMIYQNGNWFYVWN